MEPAKLMEGLFDKKRLQLIKLFLDNQEHEYGVREAAKAARIPPATAFRILQTLLKMEVVEERKIKRLRLYRLAQNKATRFLDELLAIKKTAIEEFLEVARTLSGVEEIILHGKETKEKANLLVVGQQLDVTALSRIVGEIKDRYRFTILHMTLSPEQYVQMSSMGLFSGEKRTLFRRP